MTMLMSKNKTLRSQKALLLNKLKNHHSNMRALSRKVAIVSSLRKKMQHLKKINLEQNKTITKNNATLKKNDIIKRMVTLNKSNKKKYRHKICKENDKRVERELKVKLKRKSDVEATSDVVDSDDSLSKGTITQPQLISDNGSYSTACRKAILFRI